MYIPRERLNADIIPLIGAWNKTNTGDGGERSQALLDNLQLTIG